MQEQTLSRRMEPRFWPPQIFRSDRMKNTVEQLRDALAGIGGKRVEIQSLGELELKLRKDFEAATLAVDLSDNSAVDALARLRFRAELVPIRQRALQEALDRDVASLQVKAEAFVTSELGMRARTAQEKLAQRVKKELRPHFADDLLLDNAVRSSRLVIELGGVCSVIRLSSREGREEIYAAELVAASDELDAFERTYLPEGE